MDTGSDKGVFPCFFGGKVGFEKGVMELLEKGLGYFKGGLGYIRQVQSWYDQRDVSQVSL